MSHPILLEPVSDDCLRAIVAKTMGPRATLAASHLLKGGQFNTSYYLETREPERRLVLRIAPSDDRRLFRYERGMMPAEPWIYERLAEAGVPAPGTVALDTSRDVLDRVYIVQEFVDGVPLNHASVPPEARTHLSREAGRYIARLHGVRSDRFGWPVGDGTLWGGPSWTDVFGDLLTETVEEARAVDVISTEETRAVLDYYEERRAVFDACDTPVLVHNDIWPPNILVGENSHGWEVRAVIDADRALFADREFEYVLWDDDEFSNDFKAGYGTPLDGSADAVLRRSFYRFYWYLFAAWCYRAQIWRPDAQAWCQAEAMKALRAVLPT